MSAAHKMRIALIHSHLMQRGGVETQFLSYIDELTARGIELRLIVSKVDEKIFLPASVELVKVNLSSVPKVLRSFWFSRIIHQRGLTHGCDFSLSLSRTACHDAVFVGGNHRAFLTAMGSSMWSPLDRLEMLVESKSLQHSKLIFAASSMIRDELVTFNGISADKIRVLFPPTDVKRFNRDVKNRRDECRLRFGCSPDNKVCAFVSVSHGRKGLPLLLEVFSKLRDEGYELLVAGETRVGTLPDNVRYVGYVKEPEQLYSAADALLLPAIYEPFGMVISESLLCGTPVAVSHMVGAKEIVTPTEGLVVSDFRVESWVQAVRDICSGQFHPNTQLAQMHRLSMKDHVDAMLEYWEKAKNK
jgi:glycosyltransferase involved in cell wall biosynthesis